MDRLIIRARGLTKAYGNSIALDRFSLDVEEGSLLGLLGPSGSGKTTALRVIAGFENASGTVDIRGHRVLGPATYVPPEKRRVGMVFQNYALFPHMTVERNIAYGLRRTDANARVERILDLVGLRGLGNRMPNELSGGQQQRVALARALAPEPDVILLDEPFSNLDASLRTRVRKDLKAILTEARATTVLVTHDQEEALSISDVVAVMHEGRVVQTDTPSCIYAHPANPWVAHFLGDSNAIRATGRRGYAITPLGRFKTDIDGPLTVIVRPENIQLSTRGTPNAEVVGIEFYGHDQLITASVEGIGFQVKCRVGPHEKVSLGGRVNLRVEQAQVFSIR